MLPLPIRTWSAKNLLGWLQIADNRNMFPAMRLLNAELIICTLYFYCIMAEEEKQPTGDNLRDKVMQAIKQVYDPEIPVDVYELGLIYEVNVYPVNNVYVLMTLTSPACPSAEQIPGEVEQKIKEIEGVNDVQVELTFDPPYTQDMMSEAAKLELGFL